MLSRNRTVLLPILSLIVLTTGVFAEDDGDRGRFSGFGVPARGPNGLALQGGDSPAPLMVTGYTTSREKAERSQVVEEIAVVQFQLTGLPEGTAAEDYNVRWEFDAARQGALRQTLLPNQASSLTVRYDTNNSSHRVIELTVSSSDGRWSGFTTFPLFGRRSLSPPVNDQNVLLIPMRARRRSGS